MRETVVDERARAEKRENSTRKVVNEPSLPLPSPLSTKHYCAGITANFLLFRPVFIINDELARSGASEFGENRYLPKVSIGFAILSQSAGKTACSTAGSNCKIVRGEGGKIEERRERQASSSARRRYDFMGKIRLTLCLSSSFYRLISLPSVTPLRGSAVLLERINSRRKMVRRINPSSAEFPLRPFRFACYRSRAVNRARACSFSNGFILLRIVRCVFILRALNLRRG